jgi:uncharacterized protein (TIGR03437 family)
MNTVVKFSILLIGFGMTAKAQTQPTFTAAPGSPFKVGGNPYSVAVGDFNGDGIKDLVTANTASNNVTVLLGNGSGGFTAAPGSPFAVGTNPESVVVADFNGDGIQDLATANFNSDNVTVLLGNGTGGFTPAPGSPFAVGAKPDSLVVGDFNKDGKRDLAVADYNGSNSISVLLGNGLGGFTAAPGSPFEAEIGPTSVVVGDFNGDGIQDLATANDPSNDVMVLLGNGTGGFTAAPGSPFTVGTGLLNPVSLVVGDFNGDRFQDLATANIGVKSVTVLLGDGTGRFTVATGSPFTVGSFPISVAVGDFNGDGFQDLATANEASNNVTVLLGNGSGGFTAAASSPFAAGANPYFVVVADFNGDGIQDLVTANEGSSTVTVLLGGNGSGGTATPVVKQGGIVPVYSTVSTIQPGEWVSIFGSNLASSTATWNGNFPTSLGGTTVTINGKPAYLWFVSPTQINLQAPNDTATGSVPVVITTGSGTSTSTVTLAQFAPSFSLLDNAHVTGIILRSNGSGAYGGGAYDIIGPTGNSLGYQTVAAKAGDTVELFSVGLGPTNPVVLAGQVFSSAAATTNPVNLLINKVNVIPTFAGLSSAGLYQINLTIPAGLGTGDVSLVATVGGAQTPSGVVISLQ